MEWETKQTGSLLEAIYGKVSKEGSRVGAGRSPQAPCPCWLPPSGQLSSPGLRQGWLFYRGTLDRAQAGGRLRRSSLSGCTDIRPNSSAGQVSGGVFQDMKQVDGRLGICFHGQRLS